MDRSDLYIRDVDIQVTDLEQVNLKRSLVLFIGFGKYYVEKHGRWSGPHVIMNCSQVRFWRPERRHAFWIPVWTTFQWRLQLKFSALYIRRFIRSRVTAIDKLLWRIFKSVRMSSLVIGLPITEYEKLQGGWSNHTRTRLDSLVTGG